MIDGRKKTVTAIDVEKPSKELLKLYEAKKKLFSNKLKKDTEGILNDVKVRKESRLKTNNVGDIVKKVMTNITYYTKTSSAGRVYIDKPLLMADFNIGKTFAAKIGSKIEAEQRKKKDIDS